jgi:hypothetical protein
MQRKLIIELNDIALKDLIWEEESQAMEEIQLNFYAYFF